MKIFPTAKYLEIDLSEGTVVKRTLDHHIYRKYPGGSILGLYLLMRRMNPKSEALSKDNVIVFSVSSTTGLPISGNSRMCVTTKSPLTGTIADSQAGGFFPAHLKFNGYDAVVVTGKSPNPVYLFIDGENIEIRDASKLWGKTTGDVEDLIRLELNDNQVEIAQIGIGGENLVRYAAIINMCNRANGRNGTGAVMGSKLLKAIVVKKKKGIMPYDQDRFKVLSTSVKERLRLNPNVAGLGKYGTAGDFKSMSQEGFLPTNNWTSGHFPKGEDSLDGETMYNTILKERDTCYACAVRCKRVVEIPDLVDPRYGGPEYETMATFGSYCGIDDLSYVALANQMCNMYGLDTISCGATIAFAMEAFEKGLIDRSMTDNLDVTFGNGETVITLIKKIANREGFGELLAEGSKRMSLHIGGDAIDMFMGVKGQEFPAHMPQNKPAVGMIYAVNPFGADHQSSEHDPFLIMPEDSQERKWMAQLGIQKEYNTPFVIDDEKVKFALVTQKYFSMLDSLCLCQFVWGPSWELFGPGDLIEFLKASIDWETSVVELLEIGERRINMMRYFNQINGFTKADDTLPKRIFSPMKDGNSKGIQLKEKEFYEALEYYYALAGWNVSDGNPKSTTLRSLSLEWLMENKYEN